MVTKTSYLLHTYPLKKKGKDYQVDLTSFSIHSEAKASMQQAIQLRYRRNAYQSCNNSTIVTQKFINHSKNKKCNHLIKT